MAKIKKNECSKILHYIQVSFTKHTLAYNSIQYIMDATLSFEAQLAVARYEAEMEQIEKKEALLYQQFDEELKKIQDAKLIAMQSLKNALDDLLEIAKEQNVHITIADCSDLQAQIAKVRMEYDLQQCSMNNNQQSINGTYTCGLNKRQNICAIKNVVFGHGVI